MAHTKYKIKQTVVPSVTTILSRYKNSIGLIIWSNKLGLESDPHNFLLMHAMGPNVAGVIGSAVAAGIMINYVTG